MGNLCYSGADFSRENSMNKRSWSTLFVPLLILSFAGSAQAQTANKPIRIAVDLRDATKYIFHAKLEFPAKEGPLTLVYPKWIPGDHSPTGPIMDLTGLRITADGKQIAWRRDSVDMYAFHLDVLADVKRLDIKLDYLSPAEANGSREPPAATSKIAVLNWYLV